MKFLDNFSLGDKFVMESKGFYEPPYGFMEYSMKNNDVDSEFLAKILRNDLILESYVPPREIRKIRMIVRKRNEECIINQEVAF